MRKIVVGALLFLALFISACATAPPPTPEPTATPAPTATPTVEEVTYEDPEGDCLLQSDNSPTTCDPAGIDIVHVTITRGSPLTIILELAANGVVNIPRYLLVFGFDLDRQATTGDTMAWPENHALAPDLEVVFFSDAGEVQSFVVSIGPDGTGEELDPALAEWAVLDNNHIQVMVSTDLIGDQPFNLAGDIFEEVIYDHFVDNGHLQFPEGEVVLLQ